MGLSKGETVNYSIMPEITRYSATVLSADENTIVLQTEDIQNIQRGKYIVVTGSDFKYYTEAVSVKGNILTLKQAWKEKRSYFRVDDVFPVEAKRIQAGAPHVKSKIFRGYDAETPEIALPDEAINPNLWQMLVDINAKLTVILDSLRFESEGFKKSEEKTVNLSASGIRFTIDEKVMAGDKLEIKMLLPTGPPIGILTHGNVVRVNEIGNDQYEVSLHFSDMDEEVREEIIRYAINRQREIIRKDRQQNE
jgi:hypothetical protein